MLAWVMGVSAGTLRGYKTSNILPEPCALKAAGWLRAKAAEMLALAAEYEAHAVVKAAKSAAHKERFKTGREREMERRRRVYEERNHAD